MDLLSMLLRPLLSAERSRFQSVDVVAAHSSGPGRRLARSSTLPACPTTFVTDPRQTWLLQALVRRTTQSVRGAMFVGGVSLLEVGRSPCRRGQCEVDQAG